MVLVNDYDHDGIVMMFVWRKLEMCANEGAFVIFLGLLWRRGCGSIHGDAHFLSPRIETRSIGRRCNAASHEFLAEDLQR